MPTLKPFFLRVCPNGHAWTVTLPEAKDLACPECGREAVSQSQLPFNKVIVPDQG